MCSIRNRCYAENPKNALAQRFRVARYSMNSFVLAISASMLLIPSVGSCAEPGEGHVQVCIHVALAQSASIAKIQNRFRLTPLETSLATTAGKMALTGVDPAVLSKHSTFELDAAIRASCHANIKWLMDYEETQNAVSGLLHLHHGN